MRMDRQREKRMIEEERRREREERIEDELHLEYIKMYKLLLSEKENNSS